jgi:hypothetical protein
VKHGDIVQFVPPGAVSVSEFMWLSGGGGASFSDVLRLTTKDS